MYAPPIRARPWFVCAHATHVLATRSDHQDIHRRGAQSFPCTTHGANGFDILHTSLKQQLSCPCGPSTFRIHSCVLGVISHENRCLKLHRKPFLPRAASRARNAKCGPSDPEHMLPQVRSPSGPTGRDGTNRFRLCRCSSASFMSTDPSLMLATGTSNFRTATANASESLGFTDGTLVRDRTDRTLVRDRCAMAAERPTPPRPKGRTITSQPDA